MLCTLTHFVACMLHALCTLGQESGYCTRTSTRTNSKAGQVPDGLSSWLVSMSSFENLSIFQGEMGDCVNLQPNDFSYRQWWIRGKLSRGFRFSSFFSCSLLKQLGFVHLFENSLKPRILSSSLWNFKLQCREGKKKEIQEELLQQFSRLGKTTKKPANSILAVHLCWVNLLLYKSTRAKPRCPPESSTQDLRTLFKCMTCLGFSARGTGVIGAERGRWSYLCFA